MEYYPWTDEIIGGRFSDTVTDGVITAAIETDTMKIISALGKITNGANEETALLSLLRDKTMRKSTELLKAVRSFVGESFISETDGCFSFTNDIHLIYSAFLQCYSIDISKEYIHWHRFAALLFSLPENTAFSALVRMRISSPGSLEQKLSKHRLTEIYNNERKMI